MKLPPPHTQVTDIQFVTEAEGSSTRGRPINDADDLRSMGVFCSATGNADWSAAAVCGKMFNRKLTHASGEAWKYLSGEEVFWEATEITDRYSFFAYTPFAEATNGIVVNGSSGTAGVPTLNYTVPTDVVKQPDLTVAKARYNLRPTGYPVSLNMQHALTCVGFEVKGTKNERVTAIGITGVSVEGRLPLDGSTISWSNLGAKTTTDFTASLNFDAGKNWFTAGPGMSSGLLKGDGYLMMIPQTLGPDAKLKVSVEGESATRDYSLNSQKWEPGKKISYQITLAPCEDPTAVAPSATSLTAVVNNPFTVTVSSVSFPTAGTPAAYQWYTNTSASTTGGSLISGATSASYTETRSSIEPYYYYCMVKNAVCLSDSVAAGPFTVNVTDISTVPTGTGYLTGKTCFDIAFGNDGGNCASLVNRQPQKTDFSLTTEQDPTTGTVSAPYTAAQIYTFTPTGTVSNVRFIYDDPSGKVVQSLTPKADYSGNGITTACKATVVYKPGLNDELKGLTRDMALKTNIWVIYNDGQANNGADKAIKLTAMFQDCACCGAKTISGGWLTFMCHNLGADESLDPFTYVEGNPDGSGGTMGWLFQWGRQADGHQKRNSETIPYRSATDTPGHDKFIAFTQGGTSYYDWGPNATYNKRWGNGSLDEKTPTDPCPAGWRVPNMRHWQSLLDGKSTDGNTISGTTAANGTGLANKWVLKGKGYMVGESLYLPFTGYRLNDSKGTLYALDYGCYWSTTNHGETGAIGFSQVLSFRAVDIRYTKNANLHGLAVRCVAEY